MESKDQIAEQPGEVPEGADPEATGELDPQMIAE